MNFEFEIELNKKNYFDYYFFYFCNDIRGLFWYVVLLLFSNFFFVSLFIVICKEKCNLYIFIPIIIIVATLGLCLLKFISWNDLINIQINEQVNKFKLIFNEENFFDETRLERREFKPTAILKLIETKNYLFLCQTKESAWLIPKNQIDEDTYNNIIKFLNNNNISIKKYNCC